MTFDHVGVLVADLEQAKAFARDVLGLGDPAAEFEAPEHGLAGAFFGLGTGRLELFTLETGGDRLPAGRQAAERLIVSPTYRNCRRSLQPSRKPFPTWPRYLRTSAAPTLRLMQNIPPPAWRDSSEWYLIGRPDGMTYPPQTLYAPSHSDVASDSVLRASVP